MATDLCDWTLDLAVRCRVSIVEARLMTARKVTVIAGKNGCGKSQLLTIIGSYLSNTGESWLQDLGYRTYFPKERSVVAVTGPKRVQLYHSARTIARDRQERVAGAYSFDEVLSKAPFNRFLKLRLALSKFVLEADPQLATDRTASHTVKTTNAKENLVRLLAAFEELFPGLRIEPVVDHANRTVSIFAKRSGMSFVRPGDTRFGDELQVPFGTLSDGELNALFFLYEFAYQTSRSSTPILLLIDEIENHFHPALASRFIGVLEGLLPPWAMLLATTHSPTVIASVPPASRVLMTHSSETKGDKGVNQLLVSSESATAARLLNELYGADSRANAAELLHQLETAALGEVLVYAQECMREAHAVTGSSPADPQRTFLAGLIHQQRPESAPCRILDIGAGQGRLIRGLHQDIASDASPVLAFDAVEPREAYRLKLQTLAHEYESGAVRLQKVYADIADTPDTERYNLVLLHNVIHEIPKDKIVTVLFSAISRLALNGAINILEQAVLPVGEQRYFVFSSQALAAFFLATGHQVTLSTRTSKSGIPIYEITAARIALHTVTEDTIRAALASAVETTIEEDAARIEATKNAKDTPVEMAFRAFNVAYGLRLKKALEKARVSR